MPSVHRRGLSNIDCVGRSLPVCTQYLQHKHNDTAVKVAEYAHKFAKRQCKTYPKGMTDVAESS